MAEDSPYIFASAPSYLMKVLIKKQIETKLRLNLTSVFFRCEVIKKLHMSPKVSLHAIANQSMYVDIYVCICFGFGCGISVAAMRNGGWGNWCWRHQPIGHDPIPLAKERNGGLEGETSNYPLQSFHDGYFPRTQIFEHCLTR